MPKPIEDWKNILLDTSVIIDFLMTPERVVKNDVVKNKVENTHKLFKYFEDSANDNKRTLFISSITLSELRKIGIDTSILEVLVNLFNSSDVVFVDFTKEMAMQIHTHMGLLEKEPHLNKFIKDLTTDLNKSDVYQASGWVSDDLKIVATAKFFKGKIDVVLTGDGKTFVPLAQRFEIPVVNTMELPKDLFDGLDTSRILN